MSRKPGCPWFHSSPGPTARPGGKPRASSPRIWSRSSPLIQRSRLLHAELHQDKREIGGHDSRQSTRRHAEHHPLMPRLGHETGDSCARRSVHRGGATRGRFRGFRRSWRAAAAVRRSGGVSMGPPDHLATLRVQDCHSCPRRPHRGDLPSSRLLRALAVATARTHRLSGPSPARTVTEHPGKQGCSPGCSSIPCNAVQGHAPRPADRRGDP